MILTAADRLRDHDRGAAVSLIAREYKYIYAFHRLRTANREVAEDLTQETFKKALIGVRGLKRTERLKAWVFQIARNEFSGWWRRICKWKTVTDEEVLLSLPDTNPLPDDEFIARERAEKYAALVDKLGPRDAALVRAHVFDEQSLPEVASRFGLPVGTVKSRFRAARQRLRVLFSGERE